MNTQMNVRLDRDVKAQGDEVFAALGYTPSEVVRLMWEYAARHKMDGSVQRHLQALSETGTKGEGLDQLHETRNRFAVLASDESSPLTDLSYRELKDTLTLEQLEQEGQL